MIFLLFSSLFSNELKKVSIQLKWKHQFQFAGFYMAKELGYYKDIGLEVELKEYIGENNPLEDVLNQKIDFAIDDSSLVYHKINGNQVVALFPIFQTSPIMLFTQKELTTLESLNNKYVEFSSNEISNISINAILKSQNVNIKQRIHSFYVEDFKEKRPDAIIGYLSNQPYFFEKDNISYNSFSPKDYGFDFYGDMIYSSKEYAKNNPKLINDFIEATKKGWEYAFENIDISAKIITEKYNSQNKPIEALIYEGKVLKKLSGYEENNFGKFEKNKIKDIANTITLIFPKKYKNLNLDDFIWDTKEELTNYYKNKYSKITNNLNVCVHDNLFPIDGIENTKLTGISGDILNNLAKKFNLKLTAIQSENINDLFEKINMGKCDILTVISDNSYKEYNLLMSRSNSYITTNLVIVTKIDTPFVENYHLIKDKKFVTKYESFEKYLLNLHPNIQINVNNDIEEIILKLSNNEIDGYIIDALTADRIIQDFGYGKFKISGFIESDKPIKGTFGVIKNKPELLEIINLELDVLGKTKLEEIKNSWKVTKYSTIVDNSLAWKISIFFIIILIFIILFILILNKHNKDLNTWLDSTIEGIAIFENGKLIKANKQLLNILGYEKFEEIKNKRHVDFVATVDKEIIQEKIKTNQEPYELTFIKKDGSTFDALIKGHQIEGTNKRISTIIDISELKQTQRELKELNTNLELRIQKKIEQNKEQQIIMFHQSKHAEMGSMLSIIAHQWRQPLNNISLIVNTIILQQKKETLNFEKLEKLKLDFQKHINYLSNTIDDFQDFFRPKKDKELFSIEEVIMDTYSLVKPIFHKNHITLHTYFDSNIKCYGYKNELSQVIFNILNNSKDALLENHTNNKFLKIFLNSNEKDLIIKIQDNAKGVKEDYLHKIFEPYFSTKSEKNGTGLGLYISEIIIKNHFNGKIIAKNIDEGLEVIIKIPKNLQ